MNTAWWTRRDFSVGMDLPGTTLLYCTDYATPHYTSKYATTPSRFSSSHHFFNSSIFHCFTAGGHPARVVSSLPTFCLSFFSPSNLIITFHFLSPYSNRGYEKLQQSKYISEDDEKRKCLARLRDILRLVYLPFRLSMPSPS